MKMMSPDEIPLPAFSSPTDPEAPFKKTKIRSFRTLFQLFGGLLLSALIILAHFGQGFNLAVSSASKEAVPPKSDTFNRTTSITISPCTDFYEHACSSTNEHLRNTWRWSIWREAKLYNERLLISVLSSGRARDYSASRAVSFLVDIYQKWETESEHPANSSRLPDDFYFQFILQSADFHYVLSRVYIDATMEASSRLYVEALRESSGKIVEKVKETMGRFLGPLDPLSKESLQRMSSHVGYGSWLLNDTALDTWYGLTDENAFEFKPSANFEENYKVWNYRKLIDKENQTDSLTDAFWDDPVGDPIPWAVTNLQSIFLPLGYLFPPTFQHSSSNAAAYGTIGVSAGHELVYNLLLFKNPSFNGTTQCLIEQYSAIVHPETGLNLRGKKTISEDIADNGAIKAAFEAYREDPKSTMTPETDRQFFISFAQEMCSSFAPENIKWLIENGIYSPDKYRVNVVLSNFEPFSQIFSCPLGSPMNPAKKCSVW